VCLKKQSHTIECILLGKFKFLGVICLWGYWKFKLGHSHKVFSFTLSTKWL